MKLHILYRSILICLGLFALSACGGGSNVVSDNTTGILSIESIAVPAQSGGSGTVSVKLIAPTGGPGSGSVTISSTNSSLIAFSPTSQSVNSSGKVTFYYTTTEVQTDAVVTFTVTVGSLSISNPITLRGVASTPGGPVTPPVVISPPVNSIAFISASPTSISLKGTGGAGRTETSVVSFIIRDIAGQPLAGQTVDFTLDTSVGGISLIPASAVSDASGSVKTIVNAGVISTPVRVAATVRGTNISVKSDQLTVSTGLPHQDGLSVAFSSPNPEALNYDDVIVTVSAMLSDHFGNPVPDGTSVYFTAFGGSIEPAGATKNGIATVNWRSQNPRPTDGIAKILAYAIGEESFTDLNGNGLADPGEFTDIPETFLSKSGKSTRDPASDPFIDFNGDGIYNVGDGRFNGIFQGTSSIGSPRTINVFSNSSITMSGSDAFITALDPLDLTGTGLKIFGPGNSTRVTISIMDLNRNIMPENTTTAFSFSGTCLAANPASANFRSTTAGTSIKNNCTGSGTDTLIVTVTTPKGNITRDFINIFY